MSGGRRVVVTGLGVVSPVGCTVSTFERNTLAGTSGVRRISSFVVPEHLSAIAGVVRDFEPADLEDTELDRVTQFALAAGAQAVADAGLGAYLREGQRRRNVGVYFSTAIGQISSMESAFASKTGGGTFPLRPELQPGHRRISRGVFDFGYTAGRLAARFGCRGGAVTVTTGCTGGVDALGSAIAALRSGQVELALTGAAEAPITPLVVAAFGRIGATSRRNSEPEAASRPFDVDRDGFVLGEGAGMLVLESLQHALARGARIYGEVAGFGSVNSCFHMTDIASSGAPIARSVELALADAEIGSAEVDAINAHGSSTPQNDAAEAAAYQTVFGSRSSEIPVTSLKSQLGHPLAASNSIEIISSLLSLNNGLIPPTINLMRRDPRCHLDVVTGSARRASIRVALKTSSGFSGIHSAVVLRAYSLAAS